MILAPGILWISIIFGGVIGFNRFLSIEKESGGIYGLMISPVERDVIFFGKMLSTFVFLLVIELLIFALFSILYNLSLYSPSFILLAVLATLGMSLVGTLFSTISVNTRSREVMFPILFLPVVLPLMIATVEATGSLLMEGVTKDFFNWVSLLVIFDSIFLVICPIAFTYIIED
jgi:heme exporter protein B